MGERTSPTLEMYLCKKEVSSLCEKSDVLFFCVYVLLSPSSMCGLIICVMVLYNYLSQAKCLKFLTKEVVTL
jgi:hypothetical protein